MEFIQDALEALVRWVEERYGKLAAWMTAIGGLILVFALIAFMAWYLVASSAPS